MIAKGGVDDCEVNVAAEEIGVVALVQVAAAAIVAPLNAETAAINSSGPRINSRGSAGRWCL